MPTAIPFTALGRGNGFPFCVTRKVNVSSKVKWTTLGGTQKGSFPSNSEIQTSLINAVKIFWNTNKILCSVASSKSLTPLPSIIYRKEGSSFINPTTVPEEPKDRVCERDDYSDYRNLYTVGPPGNMSGFISLSIMRMYDGDNSNEDNFVGYGLEDGFNVIANANDEPGPDPDDPPTAGNADVLTVVSSTVADLGFGQTPGTFDFDTAYKTFNGFPLAVGVLSRATALKTGSSISFSANASTASGSASYSNSDISGSCSASITGLDLYTYN